MKRASMVLIIGVVVFTVAAVSLGDFAYSDFSSTNGLTLTNSATIVNGSVARLVAGGAYDTKGALWRTDKQAVANGFDSQFTFQIVQNQQGRQADGLAFVVQNDPNGLSAIGATGGGIGYAAYSGQVGIADSVVVEIDLWDNGQEFADPVLGTNYQSTRPHISVQTRGTLQNSADHAYSLGCVQDTGQLQFTNQLAHTMDLQYQPGTLNIFVDNASTPTLSVPLNLSGLLSLDNGNAYVGFTSSTGAAGSSQDLHNWSFQSTPEPASLLLLVLGGLMVRRRR